MKCEIFKDIDYPKFAFVLNIKHRQFVVSEYKPSTVREVAEFLEKVSVNCQPSKEREK